MGEARVYHFYTSLPSTHLPTYTRFPGMLNRHVEKHNVLQAINRIDEYCLTGFSCASASQSDTLQAMGFRGQFSGGDRVQIIYGKHKSATGTVDANVFQQSLDSPNEHIPCHHMLLDNHLVITITVNQVEALT